MIYKIELEDRELAYIGQLLSEKPFKEVVNLINKIDKQVKSQFEEKTTEEKENTPS